MRRITHPIRAFLTLVALISGLSACTTPNTAVEVFDPYESTNRKVHAFNKGLDKVALRPAAKAYGAVTPSPVRQSLANVSDTLGTPSNVINDVLQGNIDDAGHNLFRFLINASVGVLGLFDPATGFGLEERDSDFGETLAVWGAPEGAYLELPVLGPATERSAVGTVVDFLSNPVEPLLGEEAETVAAVTTGTDILDTRDSLSSSIDGVLYDSADSYAQARILYLQNRRFELGGSASTDETFDPYEDLYDGLYDE